MKAALSFLLLLLGSCLAAQDAERQNHMRDSLRASFSADSAYIFRNTIAKPYLRLENRRSFIIRENVNFLGFLAGANLHNRHVVSAGMYFLTKSSKDPIALYEDRPGTQQFSSLNYFVFSYQYILLNYRYVQLNTPLEAGYGNYKAMVSDYQDPEIMHKVTGNFLPFGAGLQLIAKPVRWIGASVSGGYRKVKHDAVNLRFNGWYYSFGLWLDVRYLARQGRYQVAKKHYHKKLAELDT
jgi:hypothetical protein